MNTKKEIEIVKKNYNNNPQLEWDRLEGFTYEFEITKKFLLKHLKGKTVLDIGGGPGRYSIFLAKQGYEVTLIDLSSGNINLAKQKINENNLNIKTYEADARDLSKLNLGKFDNVLVMGPLYHLSKDDDRIKCINEAKKHLAKNGKIFVSFINITAGLNYYLDECPEKIIYEQALDLFDRMKENKSWSGMAFTQATFTHPKEIEPFFDKLGFEKITLFGQEGITGTRLEFIQNLDENIRKFYLNISLKLCENPYYYSYSNHLMYIGKLK